MPTSDRLDRSRIFATLCVVAMATTLPIVARASQRADAVAVVQGPTGAAAVPFDAFVGCGASFGTYLDLRPENKYPDSPVGGHIRRYTDYKLERADATTHQTETDFETVMNSADSKKYSTLDASMSARYGAASAKARVSRFQSTTHKSNAVKVTFFGRHNFGNFVAGKLRPDVPFVITSPPPGATHYVSQVHCQAEARFTLTVDEVEHGEESSAAASLTAAFNKAGFKASADGSTDSKFAEFVKQGRVTLSIEVHGGDWNLFAGTRGPSAPAPTGSPGAPVSSGASAEAPKTPNTDSEGRTRTPEVNQASSVLVPDSAHGTLVALNKQFGVWLDDVKAQAASGSPGPPVRFWATPLPGRPGGYISPFGDRLKDALFQYQRLSAYVDAIEVLATSEDGLAMFIDATTVPASYARMRELRDDTAAWVEALAFSKPDLRIATVENEFEAQFVKDGIGAPRARQAMGKVLVPTPAAPIRITRVVWNVPEGVLDNSASLYFEIDVEGAIVNSFRIVVPSDLGYLESREFDHYRCSAVGSLTRVLIASECSTDRAQFGCKGDSCRPLLGKDANGAEARIGTTLSGYVHVPCLKDLPTLPREINQLRAARFDAVVEMSAPGVRTYVRLALSPK